MGNAARPCMTPGAVYETVFTPSRLTFHVHLPVPILAGVPQEPIAKKVHDAVLPIIEELYRKEWTRCLSGVLIDGDYMPARHEQLRKSP